MCLLCLVFTFEMSNRLAAKHRGLLARMHRVAEAMMAQELETECIGGQPQELENVHEDADENRIRYSFHLPPFNSIDHVHMHAFHDDLRSLTWYGRLKYRTESWWCRSYEQVMAKLEEIAGSVQQDETFNAEELSSSSFESFGGEL
ncbi:unnamed protein product [Peronospora destructor]|uniref:HIT domain-containing protein n=1 Tax=Peronospora destructor TaxID=86335 RepID=A0AAV0T6P2_9STRA|nr:unnamed protein product [Peronospora destructor]